MITVSRIVLALVGVFTNCCFSEAPKAETKPVDTYKEILSAIESEKPTIFTGIVEIKRLIYLKTDEEHVFLHPINDAKLAGVVLLKADVKDWALKLKGLETGESLMVTGVFKFERFEYPMFYDANPMTQPEFKTKEAGTLSFSHSKVVLKSAEIGRK